MKFLFLWLLINCVAFAGPRQEAESYLSKSAQETSVSKRLDIFSAYFLSLPYGVNGPLGEGPDGRFDQDPLYRFDTFDCTTYVETIMSLAISNSVQEFEILLNKIRYEDGIVDYLKRNHFTDLQWIPSNIQNGFLKEINEVVVSRAEIKVAEALINFPGWIRSHKLSQIIVPMASKDEKEALLYELKSVASEYEIHLAKVPYIEINRILGRPEILNRIPHGSIVNFVRPNWDLTEAAGTHQNISHQGFLFWKGKTLFLRHASSSNGGFVQEEPFINYLKKFENHETLKGIHLMQMNSGSI